MGNTTLHNLPYPEDTASVDIPRDVRALANAVDALKGLPDKVAAGLAYIQGNGQIGASVYVTYPAGLFTTGPIVTATLQYFANQSLGLNDMTATGFTVAIYSVEGVASSLGWSYPVHWHAIAMPASTTLRTTPLVVPGTADFSDHIGRRATCHTGGCANSGISLDITTPTATTRVQCGVCENEITDVILT